MSGTLAEALTLREKKLEWLRGKCASHPALSGAKMGLLGRTIFNSVLRNSDIAVVKAEFGYVCQGGAKPTLDRFKYTTACARYGLTALSDKELNKLFGGPVQEEKVKKSKAVPLETRAAAPVVAPVVAPVAPAPSLRQQISALGFVGKVTIDLDTGKISGDWCGYREVALD